MTTDFRASAALAEPEPEGPTDEELRELWNEGWDTSEEYGAFKFARAVLARWGTPNSAETRRSLREPAEGEVAELVEGLRLISDGMNAIGHESDSWFVARAASLLERLSPPQPVPVSERLPGPEDCDAEGRCWWFDDDDDKWCLEAPFDGVRLLCWTHWLPAHALPQPS